MDKDIIIKVEHLNKIYKIFDKPIDRVKESLNPFHKRYSRDFYALNDISFEIKRGETIGIIGKNGAGKSTLLKILTGVLTPSSGKIAVNGRVASLLELGAGFNPEMTGIENIYLNGTVMGYSKEEMDGKLTNIIEFADIGDFINQPVKMYSSGMFARLAFAVNAFVEPDILIVDEALSVGDIFFQNKCFKKFEELKKSGTTILFVSHDINSIKQMCMKVFWLDHGICKMFDDKQIVCEAYFYEEIKSRNEIINLKIEKNINRDNINRDNINRDNKPLVFPKITKKGNTNCFSKKMEIKSFFFLDEHNNITQTLRIDNIYKALMVVDFHCEIKDVIFGFTMEDRKGIAILGINSFICNGGKTININNKNIVVAEFTFRLPKILNGTYLISPAIAIGSQMNHKICTWCSNAISVNVENDGYNLSLIEIDSTLDISEYNYSNIKFI